MCNVGLLPQLASSEIHSGDFIEGITGNSVLPTHTYIVELTVNL